LRQPNLDLRVLVVPPTEWLPSEFFHEPVMPEWWAIGQIEIQDDCNYIDPIRLEWAVLARYR
jgi:hypothetical protein